MTDNAPKEPTKAEQSKAEKVAEAYARSNPRVKDPDYEYRLEGDGKGGSKWVATKIERKA